MRMHEFMLAAGRATPERPAVIEFAADGRLRGMSYRRLERLVREYAVHLDGAGLHIGDRVILEADTSAAAIAMLLACSSLGVAFVPVSPETSDQRLHAIIASTRATLHVQAASGRRDDLPIPTGKFGPDGMVFARLPAARARHRREIVDTDTAYMIFTSGTTGRPKGVVMSQRAIVSFYQGMLKHGLVGPTDRVATTSPLQFDLSLLDIGLALGSGAAIVPVPRTMVRWPRRFLRVLRDAGVTQVNGVPSIWRQALRHEPERLAELTGIRGILFCREDFPVREVRLLQNLLPRARLVNCYGAAESMACSFTDVPSPVTDKLSIGFAHPGAEMMIVDETGQLITRPDVVGQIQLRTPALFTGYWDDPEGTRAALVADPADPGSGQLVLRTGDLAYQGEHGEMYFCGRVDSQVQIRGNRVELGEIERRLRDFPGITAAVVLMLERPGEEAMLGAFVVVAPDVDLGESDLNLFVTQALPEHMVPDEIHVVADLPVTSNGKVDRRALLGTLTS